MIPPAPEHVTLISWLTTIKIFDASRADQAECLLLQIPCELQMQIYESIDHAPSQVAMALTCKKMSEVASHVNLSRAYTSAKLAGLIPKEVFDVPPLMKQLSTWMPDDLRLCDHCLTYRPCAAEYWSTVIGCEKGTFWIRKTGWEFISGGWQKQMHDICPSCHLSCSLSDYIECDGCRALGRFGDIDWARVTGMQRRVEIETRAGHFAT